MNPNFFIQQASNIWNNKGNNETDSFENIFNKASNFWLSNEQNDLNSSQNIQKYQDQENLQVKDKQFYSDIHVEKNNYPNFRNQIIGSNISETSTNQQSIQIMQEEEQIKNNSKILNTSGPLRPKCNSLKIKKACSSTSSNNSSQNKRSKFTVEEDNLLLAKIDEIGKKWQLLAQFFPNKTPIMIRNRYYSKLRTSKNCKTLSQLSNSKIISDDYSQQSSSCILEKQKVLNQTYTPDLRPQKSNYFEIQNNLFSLNKSQSSQILLEDEEKMDILGEQPNFLNNNIQQNNERMDCLPTIQEEFLVNSSRNINLNNNDNINNNQNNDNMSNFLFQNNQQFDQNINQNNNFFGIQESTDYSEKNLSQKKQKQQVKPFFDLSQHQKEDFDFVKLFNADDDEFSLADEAAEMPQYTEAQQNNQYPQQQESQKIEKITFLYDQLKHIEGMIKSCKDEIFNEIKQKQAKIQQQPILQNKQY